jgi:outer membrane usher protein
MKAPWLRPHRLWQILDRKLLIVWTTGALLLVQQDRLVLASDQLQLEVFINDVPTKLIGSFVALDGQRLTARRAELKEVGVNPGDGVATDIIPLDEIAGLSYRYDVPGQRLYIIVPDTVRSIRVYEVVPSPDVSPVVQAGYGAVLNYNLFAASTGKVSPSSFAFNGVSASLDARAFSPFGTLSQTAIIRSSGAFQGDTTDSGGALRLDTTFTYSDPQTLTTYRAGDTINAGFDWTRPIRIGGFQAQRNFGLRADLVTMPLASASGSAAVPSTVDVYINDLKTFSQDVGVGPYQITNIPVVTGSGDAHVIVHDAAGHETQTTLPFYASANLLAPGLYSFSFEAGLPRINYGTTLDAYINKPVASASWRDGILDWLTIEGHAEAGAGLINAGAGAVIRTGGIGVASFALAGSRYAGAAGLQPYVSYEASFGLLTFNASSQMTFGNYSDLASATAGFQGVGVKRSDTLFNVLRYDIAFAGVPSFSAQWYDARPPKMLNRISVGAPLPSDWGNVSASYIDLRPASGDRSKIITASYSRPLPFGANLNATVFADLGSSRDKGFFLGFSVPLGAGVTASVSASAGNEGNGIGAEVTKPLGLEPGSVGWSVGDTQGKPSSQGASLSYRSSYGWAQVSAGRLNGSTTGSGQVEGSIATMGNDISFANRIDDSFAVVDAGAPNVGVLYENRPIGLTDASGHLLVPGLRSYQSNKIAIDTRNLPVDADITTTQNVVVPADRAGVRIDFGVSTKVDGAVLVLTTTDGKPVSPGTHGEIEGKSGFVVGYDGRAYVKKLEPQNTVIVETEKGACRASFTYAATPNRQQVIPVTCQ